MVTERLNEYAFLSDPPEQAPLTPRVLPDTTLPTGLTVATPEYRETAMTELIVAEAKVAVTLPFPLGVPCAIHSSMPVAFLPEHWALTNVQFNPKPATELTLTRGLEEIAAR
jgi:hypothetical protein